MHVRTSSSLPSAQHKLRSDDTVIEHQISDRDRTVADDAASEHRARVAGCDRARTLTPRGLLGVTHGARGGDSGS